MARLSILTQEEIDKELRSKACKVLAININRTITDEHIREKAFYIIPEMEYKKFLTDFKKPNYSRESYRWEYYKKIALSVKRNIRPLFKALSFTTEVNELNDAAIFLKPHIENSQSFSSYEYNEIPLGFFPKSTRKFLTYKTKGSDNKSVKKIDGDCYEFMVYLQLTKGISDGTVFIKDSISYRALEDELIDIEYWAKNKKKILKQLNLPLLSMEITDLLSFLQENLDKKYGEVNKRIDNGENTSIRIKYNKKGEPTKWTLPYSASDDGVNNPFFEQLPVISIGDVLRFSSESTHFLKKISHILPRNSKTKPSSEVINACIVANAPPTSGDMHSINRVNFALMNMFGYRFMPRFTHLNDKADNNLVSFENISEHDKHIIKPSKKVNKSLIIKEWDNVLRILASLALKKNDSKPNCTKIIFL